MSLSKIYKGTTSFVPEQILSRQTLPLEPIWQDIVAGHARSEDHDLFVSDNINENKVMPTNTADKKSLPATEPGNEAKNISSNISSKGADDSSYQAPSPAIDLELLHKKAFAEGVLIGRSQADEDFGTSIKTLSAACEQLNHLHETILLNNTKEMHSLVLQIAEKIIRHSLEEQSDTILATIKDAIHLAVKSDEFQIRVNPQDLAILKKKKKEIIDEISSLENIIIKADSTVDRGGCLLESVNCTVDATITSQLQAIKETLPLDNNAALSFPDEP